LNISRQGHPDVQKASRPKETALWAMLRACRLLSFPGMADLGTAIGGKDGEILFANNLASVAGLSYSERK